MALTQMALDSLDFDATVALAETVAPHVDISRDWYTLYQT